MRKAFLVLAMLGAVSGCSVRRESLHTTFDHSEWHAASHLWLDVPTGGFHARFRDGTIATGRFSPDETRQIKAKLATTRSAGFEDRECRNLIISNGGMATLEFSDGANRIAAPQKVGWCWTSEALDLQGFIAARLFARGEEWRMPPVYRRLVGWDFGH